MSKKSTYKVFYYFLFFLLTIQLDLSAQSKNVQLSVDQEISADTSLKLSFYIQNISGNKTILGSSNFSVFLSAANLNITGATKKDSLDGPFSARLDATSYADMTLGATPVHINLSTLQNTSGKGKGYAVPDTRTLIGTAFVPIKNPCGNSGIKWNTKPVAVNDFSMKSIKDKIEYLVPDPDFVLYKSPDAPSISSSSDSVFCQSAPPLLSTTSSVALQWYLNGNAIKGATGKEYKATQSGTYTVNANLCGKSVSSSNSKKIRISPIPDTPSVTVIGADLYSSASASNQWYFNGQPISGATGTSYTPLKSGYYSVSVSNDCGTVFSDTTKIDLTALSVPTAYAFGLSTSPNPFSGKTNISYTLPASANVLLELYSLEGIKKAELLNDRKAAGTHVQILDAYQLNLPAGTYVLKVSSDNKVGTLAMVNLK